MALRDEPKLSRFNENPISFQMFRDWSGLLIEEPSQFGAVSTLSK